MRELSSEGPAKPQNTLVLGFRVWGLRNETGPSDVGEIQNHLGGCRRTKGKLRALQLLLMAEILHYLKDPKLWEFWYIIPYNG